MKIAGRDEKEDDKEADAKSNGKESLFPAAASFPHERRLGASQLYYALMLVSQARK